MTWAPTKLNHEEFNVLGVPPIFQFLSKAVDENQENGNINASGNYAEPTDFCITAIAGYFYILETMLVTLRTAAAAGKINSGAYGNAIEITNGIKFVNGSKKVGHEYEFDVTQGAPIKLNPDWAIYTGNDTISNYGVGSEQLTSEWIFPRMGRPVILDGDIGEFACIRLEDDFSDLDGHYFQVQGMRIKK